MTHPATNNRQPSAYHAVMDWWVALAVVLVLGLMAAGIPMSLWWGGTPEAALLGAALLIALFLLVVDRAFFTYYVLADEGLLILGQIRRIAIPYRCVTAVRHGNLLGLASFGGRKRFALSADCLELSLTGWEWRLVSLSPQRQQEFLADLLGRMDEDRAARRHRRGGRQ